MSLTGARASFTTWASLRPSLPHFVVYRQLLPIPTPDDPRRHCSRPRDSAKAPGSRPPAVRSWTLRNRSPGTSAAPDAGTHGSDPKPRTCTEARVRNRWHSYSVWELEKSKDFLLPVIKLKYWDPEDGFVSYSFFNLCSSP